MPRIPAFFDVLPDETPPDERLRSIRRLNQVFHCPRYTSKTAWEKEAEAIRIHILVACGLWPMPARTPMKARVFGRIERNGYSVEKVCFESYPGFLVAGNLYRPLGKAGPFPAVLSPHGHWKRGRLANEARGSVPGRAINFALQGYVVFSPDMVGYNDSVQLDHRRRPVEEELWGLSLMGLQLWNSIRGVDFLASLPDVDPRHMACTGASGGATQTFMLTAVDERIAVSAPVNMVSAKMQGGCACENAPLLRLNLINPQIAALFAPRPMLLVSATGDWTSETPKVEYPFIRSIYRLYGAQDRVKNIHVDAGHNYNQQSREAVYRFFRRWLTGDKSGRAVKERPFTVERDEDLLAFPDRKTPRGVPDGAALARRLVAERKAGVARRLRKCAGGRGASGAKEKAALRLAFEHTLNVRQPAADDLDTTERQSVDSKGFRMEKFLLGRKSAGDRVPCLFLHPASPLARRPAVLMIHADGKEALVDAAKQEPGPLARAALGKGFSVLAIDAFLTGEYARTGAQAGRDFGGVSHWSTYNRCDHAERIQDILTAIAFLKSRRDVSRIHLAGLGRAGIWSLLARTQTRDVDQTILDLGGLDLSSDAAWLSDLFIPGLQLCGGATGAALLIAPAPLTMMNVGPGFGATLIRKAYASAGKDRLLCLRSKPLSEKALANRLDQILSQAARLYGMISPGGSFLKLRGA